MGTIAQMNRRLEALGAQEFLKELFNLSLKGVDLKSVEGLTIQDSLNSEKIKVGVKVRYMDNSTSALLELVALVPQSRIYKILMEK